MTPHTASLLNRVLVSLILVMNVPAGVAQQNGTSPDAALQQNVAFALACASLFGGLTDLSFEPAYQQAGFSAQSAASYQDRANYWTQHLMNLTGETAEVAEEAIATRLPQVYRMVDSMAGDADRRAELRPAVDDQIERCESSRMNLVAQQETLLCTGVGIPQGEQFNMGSPLSGSGAVVSLVFHKGELRYSSADLRIALSDEYLLFGSGIALDRFNGPDASYPVHIDLQWADESLNPAGQAYRSAPYSLYVALPAIRYDTSQAPMGEVTFRRGQQAPITAPLHFASYVQTYGAEPRTRPHVSDLTASRGIWQLLNGPEQGLEIRWQDANQLLMQGSIPAFNIQPYFQLLDAAYNRAASRSAEACRVL